MAQFPESKGPAGGGIVQSARSGLQVYMAQVYGWMACGMFLTAFVAFYAAHSEMVAQFVLGNRWVFYGLLLAEFGLVMTISAALQKLSASTATSLFMLYSALTGLTLSVIFLQYTSASIVSAFVVSGGMFAACSGYGFVTKRDLTRIGDFMFMGLIGIILASVVNIFFLKNEGLSWALTYLTVFVFIGLTAYDTQKLKNLGNQIDVSDAQNLRRYAIAGALTLYLDFINLFLAMLRIIGSRR